MPEKICRVLVSQVDGANILVREDGLEWPENRYIYQDADGVACLWIGPVDVPPES